MANYQSAAHFYVAGNKAHKVKAVGPLCSWQIKVLVAFDKGLLVGSKNGSSQGIYHFKTADKIGIQVKA